MQPEDDLALLPLVVGIRDEAALSRDIMDKVAFADKGELRNGRVACPRGAEAPGKNKIKSKVNHLIQAA